MNNELTAGEDAEAERIVVRQYASGKDDEAWVSIYNRARADAPEFVPETVEELRRQQERPWFKAQGLFLAELDGVPVGRVDAFYNSVEDKHGTGFIDGPHVVPEVRRRGVGTALLERALENLRERGALRAANGVGDWNTGAQAFLRAHRFEPTRTYSWMERDLAPVSGIGENREVELVPFRMNDDDIGVLYRLMDSAYAEYHNFTMGTLERFNWFVRHQEDGGTHVERFFAMDSGRPAGYIVVAVDPKENEQLGKRRGEVYTIGVLKEDRCRGIAKRLLIHAIERLREQGMDSVALGVDNQNVTSARRAYERVGFKTVRSVTWFELAL